jgi:translation initiation factor IF-2
VSQLKVFEFAKEIGMETLTLMDKIREWKLPVRSHMAELEPDMLSKIKENLEAESARKKVAKKAAAKKVAAKSADDADEKPAKKAASKTAAKVIAKPTKAVSVAGPANKITIKTATADKASLAKAAEAAALKKSSAKTVIRKKPDEAELAAIAALAKAEEDSAREALEAAAAVAASEAAAIVEAKLAVEVLKPVVKAAEVVSPVSAAVEAASAPEVDPALEAHKAAALAEEEKKAAAPGVARKREIVMTGSGPSSGIKSEAPKRNIVGRMDLSRVQGGPNYGGNQQQRPGGPTPTPGGGASRAPVGQRALRTGFVPAASPVPFEDIDSAESRKKFDDKNAKKKIGVLGGGPAPSVREREEEVATFSQTEFRKREMVFQPKKKKGLLNRESRRTELTTPKASKRVVKVNQSMSVANLAQEMGIKAAQITKALMSNGVTASMNTELDFDTISLLVPEFNFEAQNIHQTVQEMLTATAYGDMDAVQITRAPVVTVMGHVDHGKTSLLDAIRKADVASGEAGGITQHIGAYRVTTQHGNVITFIDTPGHEAFTAMRARGANITDIVVVVVAADDGVMPQTAEAINHAKAAGVPIIIAINKIDRPNANVEKIKQQMTEFELVPEEWGGSTIFCEVSALKKTGISELLEQIYLTAEMEDLKANPERSATGVVIESRLDKGRGPVATLLVQDGTLRIGQSFVVGTVSGRVRSLINDKGERVTEAGPGVPVEVLGLSESPFAGDRFDITENEGAAQKISAFRKEQAAKLNVQGKVSLEDIFAKMQNKDLKELTIVLKTDVAGSVEAIRGMFEKLGNTEVKLKIIHAAVGGINESDVLLAQTAKGLIVGFNVRPDGGAQALAKQHGIEIKTYSIVYELMDDMKKALSGMLTPTIVEKQLGRAEVRNIFSVPKLGTIAGCAVVDGKITRQAQLRLVRDGKIIYTGKLTSLKRFKDDAKEVASGYECGIGIENYNDLKVGDVIEAFTQESISREIE